MREIKFRAWDEYNKQYSEEPFYRITISNDGQVYNSENDEWYDPNTRYVIQQYTGLKDKNGKEIYEGDIVIFDSEKYIIKYSYASFGMVDKGGDIEIPLTLLTTYCIKVIGNIFENPELNAR